MIRLRSFGIACLWIPLLAGCGSVGSGNVGDSLKSADSKNGSSTTGQGNDSGLTTAGQGADCGPGAPVQGDNSPARVLLGGAHQFTWPSTTVWEVDRIPGGNDVFGTISCTGLYTAPAVVPLNPVVTIIARSSTGAAFMSAEVGALTGRRFAYVSSASDNAIEIFVADGKTGTLQPVSIFDVGAGKSPAALALSPNGNFLYSLNRGTNDISVYAVDPSSGNLTNAGSVAVPNGPNAMVFSARGKFAYVSCDGASEIAAFAVNLQDGSLSPLASGSYVAGGGRIQKLAMALDGNFLYAANPDSNQIIALSVASDGSLRPIAGSPFPAQPGLSSIVVNKGDYEYDSQNLYAGSDNGIEAYDRNPITGVLTYLPSGTQSGAGKSPLLFANTSDGLLIGVDPQSGGGFSFAFDYLAPSNSSAYLSLGGPPVITGTAPVAGAWLWGDGDKDWVYVLNRKADASTTTGSIGVYPVDYTYGMVGPSIVIATTLHDPTGLVVTP